MKLITTLLAAVATLFAAGAFAGEHSVNQRQQHQGKRIAKGVESGQLSKSEAQSLRSERRAIRSEEAAYRADGKFTKAERKHVQRDLNHLDHQIRAEKHDAERR